MGPNQFPGQTLAPLPAGISYVQDDEFSLLQKICQLLFNEFGSGGGSGATVNVGGFEIPQFNDIVIAYYGSTNNIQTQTFKNGTTTVATLAYSYVSGGAANDDNVSEIKQS